jgi:SAM-dependent methyltransferase
MSNVEFNAGFWGNHYDWSGRGEEWSEGWGGSRAQWLGSIYPRISLFLPARSVLEIAPGYGRWTQYLLSACTRYQGVDLAQKCIEACRERFSTDTKATFYKNDGKSLGFAETGSVDFLFSFDSLVHATADVMAAYVPEILRVLSRTGVAFIHHSNWLEVGGSLENTGGRGIDVSADLVSLMIHDAGGRVLIQEKINWSHAECTDCLTLFGWPGAAEPELIENHDFILERNIIRKYQSPYSRLASK